MLNSLKYTVVGVFVCSSLFCTAAAGQEVIALAPGTGCEPSEVEARAADHDLQRDDKEHPPVRRGVAVVSEPRSEPVEPPVRRVVIDAPARDELASLRVAETEFLKDKRREWNLSVKYPKHFDAAVTVEGDDEADAKTPPADKFHWKDAFYQSMIAQGFQIGYALVAQEKTRRALKGPFFHDYWESVKGVRGWDDGNRFFTNYIAHPMQGSMTGFIYLQNHDRLKKQMFNESAQYWRDRARALIWSAAWSTNWEIGPVVSQSTIGNVGLYGKQGYVDLVITPTVGTAWMITEEALDRYIIRHAEGSFTARIVLRTVLNPTRSVANMLRFKKPWYRDRAH